ncbi:MAG: FkbM family methyltransferase [Nitrospirae bacterium]|nr:FkbM family methyltransferase [Nitrospirota bacterium]
MSWRTSRTVLLMRNLGRALGVNRLVASCLGGERYEDRFQVAMLGAIRPGDLVWDVGANVGLYSRKFSEKAGPSGQVVAFEPSPDNLLRLQEAVASLGNVTVMPVALGDREAVVQFEQGLDSLGATSRIVARADGASVGQIAVQLSSGDHLVSSGRVARPNVIKIDTEGFELDVLRGLQFTLRHASVRTLCIEIHFSLLKERGLPHAPSDIEQLLVSSGFSLLWPDASHLIASRIT